MIRNTTAWNDRILPQFQTDSEGKVIGFEGETGNNYPLVFNPIEIIRSSAVKVNCASTAVDEILASFVILTGTLGPRSILQFEPVWSFTNSANNKIVKINIGSTNIYNVTRTTSAKEAPMIVLANRDALNSQVIPYVTTYVIADATAPTTSAIDFSVNQTVTITGQRANGADTLSLEYYRILHFIGD